MSTDTAMWSLCLILVLTALAACAAAPPTHQPNGDPIWLKAEDRWLYHAFRERGLPEPTQAMFERVRDIRAAVLAGRTTWAEVWENERRDQDRIMQELDLLDRMDAAAPPSQPPFFYGQYNLGRFGNYTCTTMPQLGWQTCNAVP